MTLTLFIPHDFKVNVTSLGPFAASSSSAGAAAPATGAAAVTPNSVSIAFTNSFNSSL